MELVSNNSERDLAARRAREEAEAAMVDLTANLLRIVRGAGKPYELGRQLTRCVEAMRDHWDVASQWPFNEMAAAIRLPGLYEPKYGEGRDGEWEYARQRVLRGALQYVASDLVGQRAQRASGEDDLMGGVWEFAEIRETRQKEREKLSRQQEAEISRRALAAARNVRRKPRKGAS